MVWILGEGPLTSLSTRDAEGYSNGHDRELIEWDDTHAVIVYSDYDPATDSYGDHIFVATLAVDQETGEVSKINGSKFDTIVPGDEENEVPDTFGDGDYWSCHATVRVGDRIVHWRVGTGVLYTFGIDSSTGGWVQLATPQKNPMGYAETQNHRRAGRIIPWGPNVMLLVGDTAGSQPVGAARFGTWTQSGWSYTAAGEYSESLLGDANYMTIAGIRDNGQQRAVATETFRYPPGNTGPTLQPNRHVIISGSPPNPPTFTTGPAHVGLTDFFNREMFTTDDQSSIMRAVPMHEGTTDFLTDGTNDPFDWGLVEITLDNGVLTQSAPVTIGNTDGGWYDIAMVQDALGNPVAIWPIPGFEYGVGIRGTPSALRARNLATNETVLIDKTGWDPRPTSAGDGMQQNDYSWRNLARVGSWYITAYRSVWNALIEVQSFGIPSDPEFGVMKINLGTGDAPNWVVLG